jgi:ribonuclease P protein component
MADERFQRNQRVRRAGEFRLLREQGASRAHPLLVLRYTRNELVHSRFGFIVGRRVAAKAVDRNRIRRRLREIARRTPVRPGWDLVFIARKSAAEADFAGLRRAVLELERRAGLRPVEMPGDAPLTAEA